MSGSSRNQTLSFLKQRFAEVGVNLVKRHGQNFLIDLNLLRILIDAADLQPNDVVLEVGTGTGSLTAQIAPMVAHVVTVEIDPRLHQLASEELIDADNVTMLHQDALRNKNHLDDTLLSAVKEQLAMDSGRRFKLVANLPYSVATPIISNLLLIDVPPLAMIVTIQKELADRMLALPSTKDYSALSVWIQSQCRVELIRTMPPEAFWPRPLVTSAIIRLTIDPTLRGRISDLPYFHEFVRSMFFHRRKFLRSVVVSAFKDRLDKPAVDEVLSSQGHGATARAEELTVEQMIALCDALRAKVEGALQARRASE